MNKKKLQSYRKQLIEARKKSLASFSDLDNRLESVANINGVEWINDSRATDVNSSYYSLSLFHQPIIWIVESPKDKLDYTSMEKQIRNKVKCVLVFGEDDSIIKNQIGAIANNYIYVKTLEEVVQKANELSEDNNVVLFSPASVSTVYSDYKERGEEFRSIVFRQLQQNS